MVNPDLFTGRLGNRMFEYAYLYAQARRGNIPDTYCQDEKYFLDFRDEIKQLYGAGIDTSPYVGIHVRRGDYVGNKFHVSLSDQTNYYQKAVKLFPIEREFLVFSDDPEWCKKEFRGGKFQVVSGQSEVEDFNLLASCADLIISNGSFGWWAAYLCQNPNKMIVAPRADKWFHDGMTRVGIPKEWTQIDFKIYV